MRLLGLLLPFWLLGCSGPSPIQQCLAAEGAPRDQLQRMEAIVRAKDVLARGLSKFDRVLWNELALMDTKSATVCATITVHTGLGYYSTMRFTVIDNVAFQSPDTWNSECSGRRIIESIRS